MFLKSVIEIIEQHRTTISDSNSFAEMDDYLRKIYDTYAEAFELLRGSESLDIFIERLRNAGSAHGVSWSMLETSAQITLELMEKRMLEKKKFYIEFKSKDKNLRPEDLNDPDWEHMKNLYRNGDRFYFYSSELAEIKKFGERKNKIFNNKTEGYCLVRGDTIIAVYDDTSIIL